jgi:hypothetical protein
VTDEQHRYHDQTGDARVGYCRLDGWQVFKIIRHHRLRGEQQKVAAGGDARFLVGFAAGGGDGCFVIFAAPGDGLPIAFLSAFQQQIFNGRAYSEGEHTDLKRRSRHC